MQVDEEGWETAGIRSQCVHMLKTKAGIDIGSQSSSQELYSKTRSPDVFIVSLAPL